MVRRSQLIRNRLHAALQYRLRSVLGGRLADFCRPAVVSVWMTDHCTAKCLHCDIWKNTDRENRLPLENWKSFLSDLREWLGPIHMTFTGGEALMNPDTPEVVAHAVQQGLIVEVLTHGYWEDQKKIERLALARPWKVTLSMDGIGDKHTEIRGRPKFWERTSRSIDTLLRIRSEHNTGLIIRLKHVLMSHNIGEALKIAEYGNRDGMEVCFQPISQNYNQEEDPEWFRRPGSNFPADVQPVIALIRDIIERRNQGWHISNTVTELEGMIRYFEDPDSLRTAAGGHRLHETKKYCEALTHLQIMPDGSVQDCTHNTASGNLRTARIRDIWEQRNPVWRSGCCLDKRLTNHEKTDLVRVQSLTMVDTCRQ